MIPQQTTDPTRYRFPGLFSPSHTDHISNLERALAEKDAELSGYVRKLAEQVERIAELEQQTKDRIPGDIQAFLKRLDENDEEVTSLRKERDGYLLKLAENVKEIEELKKRVSESENNADEDWLEAIAYHWNRMTGKTWETLDGECREEGLRANVSRIFLHLEELEQRLLERDAVAAVMRNAAIEALYRLADGAADQKHDPSWCRPVTLSRAEIQDVCTQAYHWLHKVKELDAGKSFLERLQKAEGELDAANQHVKIVREQSQITQDRLQAVEKAASAMAVQLTEVSKACCDLLDWDQIDGDAVTDALNEYHKALHPAPQPKEGH